MILPPKAEGLDGQATGSSPPIVGVAPLASQYPSMKDSGGGEGWGGLVLEAKRRGHGIVRNCCCGRANMLRPAQAASETHNELTF